MDSPQIYGGENRADFYFAVEQPQTLKLIDWLRGQLCGFQVHIGTAGGDDCPEFDMFVVQSDVGRETIKGLLDRFYDPISPN